MKRKGLTFAELFNNFEPVEFSRQCGSVLLVTRLDGVIKTSSFVIVCWFTRNNSIGRTIDELVRRFSTVSSKIPINISLATRKSSSALDKSLIWRNFVPRNFVLVLFEFKRPTGVTQQENAIWKCDKRCWLCNVSFGGFWRRNSLKTFDELVRSFFFNRCGVDRKLKRTSSNFVKSFWTFRDIRGLI